MKVQSQFRQSTEEDEVVVVEYVYQSEDILRTPQDAASSEFREIFKRFAESGVRPGESQ